ncbi:MAG: phage portal protein [Faecousia sp.]
MGAFDKLFGKFKVKKLLGGYFQMLDGYTPVFQTYDGGVYEMELTRACIHTFATHCSKLLPTVTGPDTRGIQAMLDGKPNIFMTGAQFLYKTATIYETQNTCFIVPVFDGFDRLIGYYPVAPDTTELRELGGEPYLVYTFGSGDKAAVELSKVGAVSKYLYRNDLVGEDNSALTPTLQLLATQNQGIEEGIKNSASFRFMATVNNFAKGADLARERKKFVEENLGPDSGGLALFPNTYTNVQQIKSNAEIVDAEQVKLIQDRVYTYFGANEDVLWNKAVGDSWSAYYEGKIEPFAIQLSQAMTAMTYTQNERTRKNAIVWSANRLQYMTNTDKLQVSSQMFDRGILSTNDVMDIWNLPHVPDGDKRYIRKEYTEITQLNQVDELRAQLAAAQAELDAAKQPQTQEPPGGPDEPKEDGNDDPE